MTMDKDSLEAMHRSYPEHEYVTVIPKDQLGGVVSLQTGSIQPWGVTSRQIGEGAWELAYTDYFQPAVYFATLVKAINGGMRIRAVAVRSANHGVESPRVFPGRPYPFGDDYSRAREVSFDRDGNLWINRSDRMMFRLDRPADPFHPEARWTVTKKVVLDQLYDTTRWVHSMRHLLLPHGGFETIEGAGAPEKNLMRMLYDREGKLVAKLDLPADSWVYGWGSNDPDHEPLFVTDIRSTAPRGIYNSHKQILPDDGTHAPVGTICGNGITRLDDHLLFTQYGQGYPTALCVRPDIGFFPAPGREGRVVIVPTALLKK